MSAARHLAALVLCAAALTACADDDPDAGRTGDPGPEATSTVTPRTDDPTGSADPSGAAAAGELVEAPTFSFHLPEGWEVRDEMGSFWICSPVGDTTGQLLFTVSWRDVQPYPTLAAMAESAKSGYADSGKKTLIQPQTTFAGQPAYHLDGDTIHGHLDEFGLEHGGGRVTVTFELDRSPAEREELISAVSAGFQLT